MTDILVVEDEPIVTLLIKETLKEEGYRTTVILNGEDAVQFALRETPHLIILDITLQRIDGYEVTRRLREHPKSMHIPIIMLSTSNAHADRVHALELGADCCIRKPFHPDELIAHVRRQLRRMQQNSLSPLTKLPGGLQLECAICAKLNAAEPWSILYLDLDNFKAYNDVYGFLAGNRMIVLVGRICKWVVHEYGNKDDFVGHVGGDDFVIMTTPDRVELLHEHIVSRYKQESAYLYHPEDLTRGFISGIDRKRHPYQAPLVSLSIGVITNQACSCYSADEIGTLAAEAKLSAKLSSRNFFHILLPRNKYYMEYTPAAHCSLARSEPSCLLAVDHSHCNRLSLVEEEALAQFL